jgi:hypothetical protein
MEHITVDQYNIFAEKIMALTSTKLNVEVDRYKRITEIRSIFPDYMKIKMMHDRDAKKLSIVIVKGHDELFRQVKYSSRWFNPYYKVWKKLEKHTENRIFNEELKLAEIRIEELNNVIGKAFPDVIEKVLLGDK